MSFGSLGSVDTAMIDRMIRVFAGLPGRFIVNVGGFLEDYHDVPDNVLLGAWFPQPSVVAQADLFIHHGGNNSFCEALYFGVPSLVMPYAWDGHDNARRAEETGTGLAMDRAGWRDEELAEKITRLLGDRAMKTRLRQNARLMQRRPGTRIAAEALLEIVDERGVKRSQG
jgi:UDP:flavonoid glycosyltransferase YjiC (YdhE family)